MAKSRVVQIRKIAHTVEVLAGDARAIQRGRIGQRVTNRVMGRLLSQVMRNIWR